jgi:hypothetical protein
MVTFVESIIYIDKIMEILGISNPEGKKRKSAEVTEENQESSSETKKTSKTKGKEWGTEFRLTSKLRRKNQKKKL